MIARPPLAVPLLALAAFGVLLGLVLGGWAPLDRADVVVSEAFRAYGSTRPGLVSVLQVATDVAVTWAYLIAGLLATLALLRRHERRAAAVCAVVTTTIPLLWELGHQLVRRPRPVNGFVMMHSNGFPSGHTSNAAAATLVAVLLLWPRQARVGRIVTVALAVGFAGFIGVTRIALLAHWPSDVLGGWLLALVVVPLAAWIAVGRTPVPHSGAGRRDVAGSAGSPSS